MLKNVVVIGGGIAGYTFALEIVGHCKRVILIEKEFTGGTCLNKGCIPTKTFLSKSLEIDDIDKLVEQTNIVVSELRQSIDRSLKEGGVEIIKGEAVIESENSISIIGQTKKIDFDILVLATGSVPRSLEIRGETDVLTTDTVFGLNEVPDKIVISGGGYMGVEFANIFSNLGSEVTIIEKENNLLPEIESSIGRYLRNSLEDKGISVYTESKIIKTENNNVMLSGGDRIPYDKILAACGRTPSPLKTKINLNNNKGWIQVDEYFKTKRDNIYAIGDCTGRLMLAHKAEYDARLLAKNLITEKPSKSDYSSIPLYIFSEPEIGVIGSFNKAEKTAKLRFSTVGRACCDGNIEGFVELAADKKNRIVGARVAHYNISEIMSALSVIVSQKMTVEEVSGLVFAHPTRSEIIKEAARRLE